MRIWQLLWTFERGLAAIVAGSCLITIILITVLSVIGRYFLQIDLVPGSYNIIERIIFPVLVFAAMPIAHRDGIFPRFELIAESMPPLAHKIIGVIVLMVEFAVYAIVFYFAVRFTAGAISSNRTMQIGTDVFPLYPIVSFIVLGFGLILIEAARLLHQDAVLLFSRGTR